jgi:hypothetical protein
MHLSGRLNKRKLTKIFLLAEYPSATPKEIEMHYLSWWHNIRDDGGLRLTDRGYDWLDSKLGLEHWSFNLKTQNITYQTVLDMDRHIDCPYWMNRRGTNIIVFGDEVATMLTLYGGDIKLFLESTKPIF